jgi:hypothetical protein
MLEMYYLVLLEQRRLVRHPLDRTRRARLSAV